MDFVDEMDAYVHQVNNVHFVHSVVFRWSKKREGDNCVLLRIFHFSQDFLFQIVIYLHFALSDLFIGCSVEAQLASSQSAAFIPHRRTKYAAGHRPRRIQVAASRFGIERRARLVVGKIREESLRFPTLAEDSGIGIAGEIILHPPDILARAFLDAQRSLRIGHRELVQPFAQTRGIESVDRKRADAALRASRAANQPGSGLSRGFGQRSIRNLDQLGISVGQRK